MNKTVIICEPVGSTDEQEVFFDDVRENIQSVKIKTNQIWENLSNHKSPTKPEIFSPTGSIPKVEIKTKTLNEPNPILAILSSKNKNDIITALFDSETDFKIESKNWLQSNDIEYIIEVIIDNKTKETWTQSKNYFSAKVNVPLSDLEHIITDLYLESLFRIYFLKNRHFSHIISPILKYNLSEMKTKFILESNNSRITEKLKFYPFSKLARQSNNDYNYSHLYNTWLVFLTQIAAKKDQYLNPPSSMLPKLSIEDAIKLLPKKYRQNHSRIYYDGIYNEMILVYLKRSIIGQTKRTKLQINNLFKNSPKIGSIIFLPRSQYKSLSKIRHLLTIIQFKTK